MLTHDVALGRSRGLVRVAAVMTGAGLIAALLAIWQLRIDAINETNDETYRLGVILAEETTRALQNADVVLQEIRLQIGRAGATDGTSLRASFGDWEANLALKERLANLPQVEAFSIVGPDGHFIETTRAWPAPTLSVSDRPFFHHFAAIPYPGAVLTDPIVNRVDNTTTVLLVRGLRAPDGAFLGLLTASIRLGYFSDFLAAAQLSAGVGVTIAKKDGTILSHFPENTKVGTRLPPDLPFYDMVAAGGGHYRSTGFADSRGPGFVSVHPLAAYPLVIDVSRLERDALAHWRRQALEIGGGVFCAALCLAMLLRGMSRQFASIEVSQERVRRHADALRDSEARLAEQSARLQNTLEHMNQGLIMVDAAGIVAVCNRRASELLGLPPEVVTAGPRFIDLIAYQMRVDEIDLPENFDPEHNPNARIVDRETTYERRRPNGTILEVHSVPLKGGGMVRTFTDVTARAVVEDVLSHAASHDQLTGLPNRAALTTCFDEALSVAKRQRGELAVLCLDLDRFKLINDTLGHAAGDQLLTLAGQRMRNVLRQSDTLARMGGDEFTVLLVDHAGPASIEQIAQRLLDAVAMPYMLAGKEARVGVSIGIAVYPGDGATTEHLLRNADIALYQAKAAGRNGWHFYSTEDGKRERERTALEQDLRAAVEQARFTLAYQPICASATGMPVAFEALLRWPHPRRGPVSPAEFIPVAEATGLILPLGRWVIETACAEAATWAVPARVAVNLSPAQFREQGLIEFIRGVLARTGLHPARLELEVTEGLLLEHNGHVLDAMHALRAMGIRMVLDDFGTAHSSLSYLRDFPFDQVKIDGSFMRALNSDRHARALVEAMLAMARALGIEVVGEGVETQEQLTLLRALRCEHVQGYFLGRPEASERARELLWRLATQRGENLERVAV